jgi:hypothetical protein
VFLVKSQSDRDTYLVNDTADPLQRSLTSLELTDVLLGAPPPGASSTFAPAGDETRSGSPTTLLLGKSRVARRALPRALTRCLSLLQENPKKHKKVKSTGVLA